MIRPLVAIGALVVLTFVAEAASTKYDDYYKGDFYGKSASSYGGDSYKHDPEYYEEEYREPTYEKYDDEYGYEEHKYDHKPMYKHKTMKSHYGYGGDSYGKSYSSYKPSSYKKYRQKRSMEEREKQISLFQGSDSFSLSFLGSEVEDTKLSKEEREKQFAILQGDDSFSLSLPGSGQVEDANTSEDQSPHLAVQDIREQLALAQQIAGEKIAELESGVREGNHHLKCFPCDSLFPCNVCCIGTKCIPCESRFLGVPLCGRNCCETWS